MNNQKVSASYFVKFLLQLTENNKILWEESSTGIMFTVINGIRVELHHDQRWNPVYLRLTPGAGWETFILWPVQGILDKVSRQFKVSPHQTE